MEMQEICEVTSDCWTLTYGTYLNHNSQSGLVSSIWPVCWYVFLFNSIIFFYIAPHDSRCPKALHIIMQRYYNSIFVVGDSGKTKLPFNNTEPLAEPGSGKGRLITRINKNQLCASFQNDSD